MRTIVFDTETTGTNSAIDQVIEAAWLTLPATPQDLLNLPQVPGIEYHQYFKPDVEIAIGAQATHNILMADLRGRPHPSTLVFPDVVEYTVGHNIDFDLDMAAYESHGICTLALSRYLFPQAESHTQSAMLYLFGRRDGGDAGEVEIRGLLKNAHSAAADVRNCTLLLQHLLNEALINGYDISSWAAVYNLSEVARIPKVMSFGKHKGEAIASVPVSYARWYSREADQDKYLIQAFKNAGLL